MSEFLGRIPVPQDLHPASSLSTDSGTGITADPEACTLQNGPTPKVEQRDARRTCILGPPSAGRDNVDRDRLASTSGKARQGVVGSSSDAPDTSARSGRDDH